MGRAPCCDKANVKKGPWSPEEDAKLKDYIDKYGTGGNWIALPQKVGLKRCGKSCRLRWLNYLRPNIKHGGFSDEEDRVICSLYASVGSRWSVIASQLPGRTDNDIKNYWNTKLKKKIMGLFASSSSSSSASTFSQKPKPTFDHLYPSTYTYFQTPSKLVPTPAGFEIISTLPNLLGNNSNNNNSDTSFGSSLDLVQNQDISNNNNNVTSFFMFGSDQGSCNSINSDGSIGQISYGGKEMKHEDYNRIISTFPNCNVFNENDILEADQKNNNFVLNGYVNGDGSHYRSQENNNNVSSWSSNEKVNNLNNNGYFGSSISMNLQDYGGGSKQIVAISNVGNEGGDDETSIFQNNNRSTVQFKEKEEAMYYYCNY